MICEIVLMKFAAIFLPGCCGQGPADNTKQSKLTVLLFAVCFLYLLFFVIHIKHALEIFQSFELNLSPNYSHYFNHYIFIARIYLCYPYMNSV